MRRGAVILLLAAGCAGSGSSARSPAADVARTAPDPGPSSADPGRAPDTASASKEETLGRCAHFDPLRQPFFGDTHVHTALSMDAVTQGTRLRPSDAYRFARGETVGLQPHDADGNPLRTLTLDRPLDFAVVTDHAEFLGEVTICSQPGREGHESDFCRAFRDSPGIAFLLFNSQLAATPESAERSEFCGVDGATCLAAAATPWQEIQEAAEAAYDRTATCAFTTFVGYEWSGSPATQNLHRNVIFRNHRVPALPTSWFEEGLPEGLWDRLDAGCRQAGTGCDALTIPHNPNLSSGLMFEPLDRHGNPFNAAYARRRAAMEPLLEVFQHKGDSECLPGAGDELCSFEKLPFALLSGSRLGIDSPAHPSDFARAALGEGLRYQRSLGENPFKYGLIASTDTHLGTPGAVSEASHPGHGGAGPAARTEVPAGLTDHVAYNPGGLIGVWAEENSREAIFQALRRREAFGTSGPRIVVRLFAGWDLPAGLCAAGDFAATGYAQGVPMGSDLPVPPSGAAGPVLAVSVSADPGVAGAPGTPLQRIQVVKGWLDGDTPRIQVVDVAGQADNGASVDPATCAPTGDGWPSLCAVWRDPDFDATVPAFYYVRAVENPTCRWSARQCLAAGIECGGSSPVPEGFAGCCDDRFPKTVQERAWSSPVWYAPPT